MDEERAADRIVPVTEVNWLGDTHFEGEIAITARIRSTRPPRG